MKFNTSARHCKKLAGAPTTPPIRLQERPRWLANGSKSASDGSRSAQDASRSAQDGSRSAQDTFRTAPQAPKKPPRRLQERPRRPQSLQDTSKRVPRTTHGGPQGSPSACRDALCSIQGLPEDMTSRLSCEQNLSNPAASAAKALSSSACRLVRRRTAGQWIDG